TPSTQSARRQTEYFRFFLPFNWPAQDWKNGERHGRPAILKSRQAEPLLCPRIVRKPVQLHWLKPPEQAVLPSPLAWAQHKRMAWYIKRESFERNFWFPDTEVCGP